MKSHPTIHELKAQLAVQSSVADLLAKATYLSEATPAFLELICGGLGWDWGAFWSVDRSAGVLRCVSTWHRPSVDIAEYEALTRRLTFAPGQPVLGLVWETNASRWVADLSQLANSQRAEAARDAGLHSGIAFPVSLGGEVLGVMELFGRTFREKDDDLVSFLSGLGSQIAQFIKRTSVEEELRLSSQSLADAQRVAHIGSWEWRPQTGTLAWSDETYRIFGLEPQEFVPSYERFLNLIVPSDQARLNDAVQAALKGARPYFIDHRIARPNGEIRVVHSEGGVTFGVDGLPVRMIGTIQDVTESDRGRQDRERLLSHEQALARIAHSLVRELTLPGVVDAVIDQTLDVLEVDFVSVWLADNVKRELSLHSSSGRLGASLAFPRTLSYDAPAATARAARLGQFQIVEDVSKLADLSLTRELSPATGTRSVAAMPLFSRGDLVGVVTYSWREPRHLSTIDREFHATIANLFAVAISNARLYDRVTETLRLREEFMGSAAHELRTPLTVIKGTSQFALKNDAREATARRALETIIRQSDRIASVIDDLINVMRFGPGHVPINRERFDLNAVAREVVERTGRSIDPTRVRLESSGRLIVSADREQVARILTRLIDNAYRYSPPEGTIDVKSSRANGEAVISVTDHGVGIRPERQPHVFEPFYETVPAGAPGYVGIVSLGLYVSKQVLADLGGRIWIDSDPGQGATFSFSLPLAEEAGQQVRASG